MNIRDLLLAAMALCAVEAHALRVVGVMTGTSCDGLDAACLEIIGNTWQPVWFASRPYPASLRERVFAVQQTSTLVSVRDLLQLDHDLGVWYAHELSEIIHGPGSEVDVIALHGQTIAHHPDQGLTLQLGNPFLIAAATGTTVVHNMRQGDQAAGGQGAPLVPIFHKQLAQFLPEASQGIAIHNIGGMSNITYLAPSGEIIAFDTGPGNVFIDAAMQELTQGKELFDRDGLVAAEASVDDAMLTRLLEHPFFAQVPPKSTGRDEFLSAQFVREFMASPATLVATATRLTVESIVRAYEQWIMGRGFPLTTVYLCGGGAYNKTLMRWLQERLAPVRVVSLESVGFNNQAIESQACAWWGYLSLCGQSLGGSWTGATRFAPPGAIVPGANWSEVLRKLS